MRKVLMAMVALGSLATAMPASAQWQPNDHYNNGYNNNGYNNGRTNIQQLAQRIERGVQRGDISNREAYGLRVELRQIQQLHYRFARDGVSRWERDQLDRRTEALAQRIRYERNDGNGRNWNRNDGNYRDYDRDGRDDRYDRDDHDYRR